MDSKQLEIVKLLLSKKSCSTHQENTVVSVKSNVAQDCNMFPVAIFKIFTDTEKKPVQLMKHLKPLQIYGLDK